MKRPGNFHVEVAAHPLPSQIGLSHEVSTYQVMLAWALAKGDFVLPIPGARRKQSILDSVRSVHVDLSAEELSQIDEVEFLA